MRGATLDFDEAWVFRERRRALAAPGRRLFLVTLEKKAILK